MGLIFERTRSSSAQAWSTLRPTFDDSSVELVPTSLIVRPTSTAFGPTSPELGQGSTKFWRFRPRMRRDSRVNLPRCCAALEQERILSNAVYGITQHTRQARGSVFRRDHTRSAVLQRGVCVHLGSAFCVPPPRLEDYGFRERLSTNRHDLRDALARPVASAAGPGPRPPSPRSRCVGRNGLRTPAAMLRGLYPRKVKASMSPTTHALSVLKRGRTRAWVRRKIGCPRLRWEEPWRQFCR